MVEHALASLGAEEHPLGLDAQQDGLQLLGCDVMDAGDHRFLRCAAGGRLAQSDAVPKSRGTRIACKLLTFVTAQMHRIADNGP